MTIGIAQSSMGLGRLGVSGPPNVIKPSGNTIVNNSEVNEPFYATGPFWVMVFLAVGYLLVFQTLK